VTPKKRARSVSPEPKSTAKARKNKARRERQKAQLQKAKALTAPSAKETARKPARDERVPAKEWQKIISFKYTGGKRCPFFNSSLGCRFGDQCKLKHSCAECGQNHFWHGNH
jgi:hypothetical protein